MDYDLEEMKLYWADNTRKVIYTAPIRGSWTDITVVIRDTGRVDGVAVDWIGRHVYWTDDDKDTVEVAQLSGQHRTTLIRTGLDKPRDIALDPVHGYMYWTDWGVVAKIERSHMDGQNREILVSSEISWPNGLALDLPNKRLYWTDGKRQKIESVRHNGSSRRSFDLGRRSHPFSVAVFGDHVFWTDALSSTLERADKRNGENRAVLLHTKDRVSNVRVLHTLKKPKIPNPCRHANCQHICLLSPHNYNCACSGSINSTACLQGNHSAVNRTVITHAKDKPEQRPLLSTRSYILPKPTQKIFWNKTNRKSIKTNRKSFPSVSNHGNESLNANLSRELALCLIEMCKVMEECVSRGIMRNGTKLSDLVRKMGNCSCADHMQGICGALMRRKKTKPPSNGFKVNWILFILVSLVLMILTIIIIWYKIHDKLTVGPRVVYNKKLQRIKLTNVPTHDYDDLDDDDDTCAYNLTSGYENPVYLASTSGRPRSTSGIFRSTSGHLNPVGKSTVSKGSNQDDICTNKLSYSHATTDVNDTESHQFINPVYFSPGVQC